MRAIVTPQNVLHHADWKGEQQIRILHQEKIEDRIEEELSCKRWRQPQEYLLWRLRIHRDMAPGRRVGRQRQPREQVWTGVGMPRNGAIEPEGTKGKALQGGRIQIHLFELRGNPVISRKGDNGAQRHDVVMDAKKRLLAARGLTNWAAWTPDRITTDGQADPPPPLYEVVHSACAAWLASRAEQHGFTLDESTLNVAAYEQHGGKRGQLRFSTVDLTGELVVTDAARFATTLASGIGRAKAFGCGLLLVRPLA